MKTHMVYVENKFAKLQQVKLKHWHFAVPGDVAVHTPVPRNLLTIKDYSYFEEIFLLFVK